LNWLVQGYLAYCREGLREPQAVLDATGRYRGDSDPLGDFLAEHCVDDSGGMVVAKELYRVYSEGGGKWSRTAFGKAISERYEKARPDKGEYRKRTVYLGLRFRDDFDDFDDQDEPTTTGGL